MSLPTLETLMSRAWHRLLCPLLSIYWDAFVCSFFYQDVTSGSFRGTHSWLEWFTEDPLSFHKVFISVPCNRLPRSCNSSSRTSVHPLLHLFYLYYDLFTQLQPYYFTELPVRFRKPNPRRPLLSGIVVNVPTWLVPRSVTTYLFTELYTDVLYLYDYVSWSPVTAVLWSFLCPVGRSVLYSLLRTWSTTVVYPLLRVYKNLLGPFFQFWTSFYGILQREMNRFRLYGTVTRTRVLFFSFHEDSGLRGPRDSFLLQLETLNVS